MKLSNILPLRSKVGVFSLRSLAKAMPGRISSKKDKPQKDEGRFSTNIFTISVGPNEERFTADESYLRRSPVFAVMCKEEFKESIDQHIKLPKDDPKEIGIILDFFYTGDFWRHRELDQEPNQSDIATELANLYVTVDKYMILGMKALICEKLLLILSFERFDDLVTAARRIYSSIPDSDDAFPSVFRYVLGQMKTTEHQTEVIKEGLIACVRDGGRLAVDTHIVMEAWHLKQEQQRKACRMRTSKRSEYEDRPPSPRESIRGFESERQFV